MSFLPLPGAFTSFAVPGYRPGVVSLLVGGMLYEDFKQVSVSRSVKEMAGSFSLDVSERWTGGRDGPSSLLGWRIRPGDPCTVLYAGIPVITGHVDTYEPKYDATSHDVKIQGRSKTADLVDSSADPDVPGGEMREVKLDQIARKLAQPHGIGVKIEADVAERFDVARVTPGETKHKMLERYARPGAVALTDDAEGNLRLLHAQAGAPVAILTEGVNILKASATLRADNRYSDYEVKGQNHGSDEKWGQQVSEIRATSKDAAVKRYRPLTMINETKTTPKNAKGRCDWESSARSGESTRAKVSVVDWVAGGGRLWTPGDRVLLVSPMLAIHEVMTIESVNFQQSDSNGTTTDLSLIPVEGLNPKAASGGAGGSGGGQSDKIYKETRPKAPAVPEVPPAPWTGGN